MALSINTTTPFKRIFEIKTYSMIRSSSREVLDTLLTQMISLDVELLEEYVFNDGKVIVGKVKPFTKPYVIMDFIKSKNALLWSDGCLNSYICGLEDMVINRLELPPFPTMVITWGHAFNSHGVAGWQLKQLESNFNGQKLFTIDKRLTNPFAKCIRVFNTTDQLNSDSDWNIPIDSFITTEERRRIESRVTMKVIEILNDYIVKLPSLHQEDEIFTI